MTETTRAPIHHLLALGEVHPQWPEIGPERQGLEWAEYNVVGGQHQLLIALRAPTPAEAAAVQAEPCRFAMAVEGPAIFILAQFGVDGPWLDAPFSIHLVHPDCRKLPDPADPTDVTSRILLSVALLDSVTGKVAALRATTYGPAFTRALEDAITAQAETPWMGGEAFDRDLSTIYSRYDALALLGRAAVWTVGGE